MNTNVFHRAVAKEVLSRCHVAKLLAIAGLVLLAVASAQATDLVWIGGTGLWNVAGNWSPAQVPTAADNAFITNNGTYAVSFPNGINGTVASLTLGGATGGQTLSLAQNVLTLNSASTINANGVLVLTIGNSVLTGGGTLTVNGALNWAGGTMSGAGATTIGSSGVLTISGGTTLTTRTLDNAGQVSWNAGNMTAGTGAVINNQAGGVFDVNFDGRINVGTAPATFNNAGLLRKTAGTLTATIVAAFNNTGTVQAQATTLSFDGGGTHTGIFSNAPGATANFGGGAHVLSVGSLVTGTGTLGVSGTTTLTANGNFDAGSILNCTGGNTTLSAGCNVTGTTVSVAGGLLIYNSAGSAAALNVTSGTLGGTSPVNITGVTTLSGGTITNGLVTASGGLNMTGGFTLNGGRLVNVSNATWSAGAIIGANGAAFTNQLGATLTNTFDGNINVGAGATPVFVNAGLFQKTGATAALGNTSIDFTFINTGTVEVQTNSMRYKINQQNAGLTLLDGGDGITAQAQPIQILGGSLVGNGTVTVANNQNVVNAAVISPGLPLGQLNVAGNYQQSVSGALNIDLGGYVAGTSFDLITVAAGGGGGVATLNGTLNISITNGFSPTNGATFTFLTANSRVGAFSTFNYPSSDIGLTVSYDATSAKVTVSNLKPLVANLISNPAATTYGATFSFQFPANTFTDPDNNALTYTATGLPPGITFTGATRTFSGNPTQAGAFPVTVTATDNGVPSLAVTNTFTITVNPASLSVAADAKSKIYGAADPALTLTTTGLQFSDTAATVLTGALVRAAGETVSLSPYAITQGTLAANSNYTLSFTGSSLTISKVVLSVTADAKSKIYGAADPTITASYAGFVIGETPAVLGGTLSFTRAPGANVGNYLITPSGLTSGNYAITFNTGLLAITQATLSITADAKTKVFGGVDPAFTVTYSGFVLGDTSAALAGTLSFTRAPGENVGSYLITPSGQTSGNYTITYNTGLLTITRAPLSITADAKTKVYGAADPANTVSYAGFVNGETAAVLGGTLSFTRAPGENIGTYPITPSGQTSGNYTVTFNTGSLTITKAALSVSTDAKTKVYGAADPALTLTATGFQFTDTAATALSGALTRTAGETVAGSPYAITQGTLLPNGNYTITFTGSTLTITRAALSITADAKTKVYGAADPANTVTYAGFVNSETSAVFSGTLSFTRAPGENVGSYLITPSGQTSGNYTITFNTGSLAITKAALSITADAKTKVYGAADPVNTVTYSGLVPGETPAVLGGTLSFTRAPGEIVGSYLITPSGLTSGNYTITFNTGSLTITAFGPLLLPLTLLGQTNVVITWNSVTNGSYRVQFKPILDAANWTDLAGDVTATGNTASKTDIQTSTNRFYRVQVVP